MESVLVTGHGNNTLLNMALFTILTINSRLLLDKCARRNSPEMP